MTSYETSVHQSRSLPEFPNSYRSGDTETYSRVRERRREINIITKLKNSETLGKRLRNFSQLPRGFVERYQKRFQSTFDIPVRVHELSLMTNNQNTQVDIRCPSFKSVIEVLFDTAEYSHSTGNKEVQKEIYYSGGVEILVDLLTKGLYDQTQDIDKDTEIKHVDSQDQPVLRNALGILLFIGQDVSDSLSHLHKNRHLLHLLFSLIVIDDSQLYVDATILLERIMIADHKPVLIDLRSIACLPAVLNKSMFHIQQTNLYRVLMSTIAVVESAMGMDSSLQEFDSWLLDDKKAKLEVLNQEYLLNSHIFLENLFNVTTATLPALSVDREGRMIGMLGERTAISQQNSEFGLFGENRDNPFYRVVLYYERTARANAYLLLSTLISGKCREQMQTNVVKYDLIRGLERSVHLLVWDCVESDDLDDVYGQDQNTQIHYLRLIYSIADHRVNRYLLLNEKELQEIQEIAETQSVELPEGSHNMDKTKCCQRSEGLLVEIIQHMKDEPCTSYARYWMARTMESFLRCSRSLPHQIFLMRRGLFQDLFEILLNFQDQSPEVIQGHFDLLSSVMKNNKLAFEECSKIVSTNHKFLKLCSMIEMHLVDSNMFVRSIILSLHYFESFGEKFQNFIKSSRILMHYVPLQKQIEVIYNLVQMLDIKTLSQDNVSCLNTSILILLIADLNDQLPKYLSLLASYSDGVVWKGGDFLLKLRDLLEFWLKHYSYSFKESDVQSLEEMTGFKFPQWKELVNELIKHDVTSPSAILRYLDYLDPLVTQRSSLKPPCFRTS